MVVEWIQDCTPTIVSTVAGDYKQTPAGTRMSRTDVAFGVQSGVREGLWLSCFEVPRGRPQLQLIRDHVSM
jgi:hypothetical protein